MICMGDESRLLMPPPVLVWILSSAGLDQLDRRVRGTCWTLLKTELNDPRVNQHLEASSLFFFFNLILTLWKH